MSPFTPAPHRHDIRRPALTVAFGPALAAAVDDRYRQTFVAPGAPSAAWPGGRDVFGNKK